MNKLLQTVIVASLITASAATQAHPVYGPHYWGHNHYGWVAPLVIGSAVGYAVATRPQVVVVQQPPNTYYQPQAPYGYHYENILDANCQCYRLVLVQNQ